MPTLLTSQNITGVQLKESAAPATPASGYGRIYLDTSGVLHFIDDAGTDYSLTVIGTASIANNAVTDAKLRDSAAVSVIGRSANSSGDPADIVASTNRYFLARKSDTLVFGAIEEADLPAITAFALPGDISPSALGADTNDWNPTGLSTAAVIRASTSANYALTGLQGGSDGRMVIVHNVGSYDLQLKAEDSGSTAAYRFALRDNLRLFPSCAAMLQYDATSSRWRCIGHSGKFARDTVQEKNVVKSSVFTSSSTSFTDITDLTLSITPRSSTSIIEISAMVAGTGDAGGSFIFATRMMRDSTPILVGDSAGSRTQASTYGAIQYAISQAIIGTDAPATTSATTYKIQGVTLNGGAGFAINKNQSSDSDLAVYARLASAITVREVCQ